MAILESVSGCPLFYELYDHEIESIVNQCYVVDYAPGDVIVRDGDQGSDFYIVISGEAAITKEVEGRTLLIDTLLPGDVFGETVLINEMQRLADVSSTKHSNILVVDYDSILSLYKRKPSIFAVIILNLSRMLVKRIQHSNRVIVDEVNSTKPA